jgi:hypothetical protein
VAPTDPRSTVPGGRFRDATTAELQADRRGPDEPADTWFTPPRYRRW